MTAHEQPAAGVALKLFPEGTKDVQSQFVIVHQLRASADIQDGETKRETGWATTSDRARLMRQAADTIEALTAPTDAGGAVSEAAFIQGFDDGYEACAGGHDKDHTMCWAAHQEVMAALTPAPQAEGEKLRPIPSHPDAPLGRPKAPQPLQQGGEVTRAKADVMGVLCGAWADDLPTDQTADAILALFASLAADRDKAVGIANRQADNMAFVINHVELHGWHDKFLRELEEDRDALSRLSRQKDQPHD